MTVVDEIKTKAGDIHADLKYLTRQLDDLHAKVDDVRCASWIILVTIVAAFVLGAWLL